MKRTLIGAGLFAILAATSFAQSVVAQVPFNFNLVNTSLPAGKYIISQNGSVVKFATFGKTAVMTITTPADRGHQQNNPSLEFRRFGDEYFLTNVWDGGHSASGRTLPVGQRQKELARNQTPSSTKEIVLAQNSDPKDVH